MAKKAPSQSKKWLPVTLLALLLGLYLPCVPARDNPSTLHEQAIRQARAGHFDQALTILHTLVDQYPRNQNYRYDLIVVLSWAEQDSQALANARSLPLSGLPDYVLENLGQSALRLQDYFSMADIFSLLVAHQPDNDDFRIRLAWAQIENGKPKRAFATLQARSGSPDAYINRLTRLDRLAREHQAYFTALAVLDKLATLTADPQITKQRILTISAMTAEHLADQLAEPQPQLFSQTERAGLTGNRIARTIAWGKLPRQENQPPFAETDRAIDALLRQFSDYELDSTPYSEAALRSRFDLIEALHDRQRMEDIVTLHQRLNKQDIVIPDYALSSIADAYHSTHRPDIAKDIYLDILNRQPDRLDIQLALFYVYLDLEDYRSAIDLIDTLAAQQQAWPSASFANWDKLDIDIMAAMVRAYARRPHLAEQRLQGLLDAAPYNSELRANLATVYYWRGWPRRALQHLDRALAIDANNFSARETRFNVLLSLAEFERAERELENLQQQFPGYRRLGNSERTWQLHNSNALYIEVNRSRSSGAQEGSADLTAEVTLYSRPLRHHWRPFIADYYAKTKFPEGPFDFQQFAVGLEYRQRDITINTLLDHDDFNTGVAINGTWMPDDQWTFNARYDSNDKTVPLRGRLNENIDGWLAAAGVRYQWHESRSVEGSLQQQRFSDDNRRDSLSLALQQRLRASAHYLLTGQLAYYSSQNTRLNASYYNPQQDSTIELALTNEWIQYRHYSDSLLHRLVLAVSQYDQQGYAGAGLWNAYYEQQWNLRDTLELAYGLGRASHSYDGSREYSDWLSLRLSWLF